MDYTESLTIELNALLAHKANNTRPANMPSWQSIDERIELVKQDLNSLKCNPEDYFQS